MLNKRYIIIWYKYVPNIAWDIFIPHVSNFTKGLQVILAAAMVQTDEEQRSDTQFQILDWSLVSHSFPELTEVRKFG